MVRRYSRLVSLEERRNKQRTIFYIFLTISLLLLFIIFGIPTLAKFGAFISGLRGGETQTQETDKVPPTKPVFLTTDVATNSAILIITGLSEPEVEIVLFQNGKELEKTVVDETGLFKKEANLIEGENSFVARAKDRSGNEGQNSKPLLVILDTESPKITVTEPTNREFVGAKQQMVTIRGRVSEESQVFVNNRITTVDANNNFSFQLKLAPGENKVTIKAIDKAGNEVQEELLLMFSS